MKKTVSRSISNLVCFFAVCFIMISCAQLNTMSDGSGGSSGQSQKTDVSSSAFSVTSTGGVTTAGHNKQVIGYITQWDAWKAEKAGVSKGSLNQLNVDFSKYTIMNFSFFGVAQDGSLHSGDLRDKQIYQKGVNQKPGDLLYVDLYSSWDLPILYGEMEKVQWINDEVVQRATDQGFVVKKGGMSWSKPEWRIKDAPLPLPLKKEGSAPGLLELGKSNGVKVVASIGGWSMCKHFSEVAADSAKRAKFIADCERLIAMGFDGIDLDWEYPGYEGMNFQGSPADFANFQTLITEIRAALDAIRPGLLLTSCFSTDVNKIDSFDWNVLSAKLDYFNFMTYDMNGGWSTKAGHNSPLYTYDNAAVARFNWQTLLEKVEELQIPKSKVNFGVPFYGRGVVCDGPAALNAPTVKKSVTIQPDGPISTCADYTNWPMEVYDGTPYYFFIGQKTGYGTKGGWTKHWDDQAKVPYLTNGNFFLSYDDEESIGLKARFIKDNSLAGTIIWTVYGDLELNGSATSHSGLVQYSSVNSPLVNKINEVFANGSTNKRPTVSIGSPADLSVVKTGSALTVTASANDTDGTISRVEFKDGSSTIGTFTPNAASGEYSASIASISEGQHVLTVIVTDNKGASAQESVTITAESDPGNILPTVEITSPADQAKFKEGTDVAITASAADKDGTIIKVVFKAGETIIGEFTPNTASGSYTAALQAITPGNHTITVTVTDDKNAVASASITVIGEKETTGPDEWIRDKVYEKAGYKVSWKGKTYENKWWTRGEEPGTTGEWGVWKELP